MNFASTRTTRKAAALKYKKGGKVSFRRTRQLFRHKRMEEAARTTAVLNTMTMAKVKVAAKLEVAPLWNSTSREEELGRSGTSASAAAT